MTDIAEGQAGLFSAGERLCAIWTARISYSGPRRLDVTRKGGSVFGPSWPLLHWARSKPRDDDHWDVYRMRYIYQMRRCYAEHHDHWIELLQRRGVVLCCYCSDPQRCHRTVLAELLVKTGERLGLPAAYFGETRG
jgi:hypothetical protein